MVEFVSMLAQPVKKMMPQAAKMRIRLELIILVFMVRCALTNLDLQVEPSTAAVNSLLRPAFRAKQVNGLRRGQPPTGIDDAKKCALRMPRVRNDGKSRH